MSIGAGLGGVGVCVVSGAARGIDAASHRGALDAGGTSIAVLGSGHDLPYPKGSSELVERIAAAGAVVSEYAPGVRGGAVPVPGAQPIGGCARASPRGGRRRPRQRLDDLGRPRARPRARRLRRAGPVTSPLAEVPLSLIREGATMIRGADDLLDDLGLLGEAAARAATEPGRRRATRSTRRSGHRGFPMRSRPRPTLPLSSVTTILLSLELKGLVRGVGGRYERRVVGQTSSRSQAWLSPIGAFAWQASRVRFRRRASPVRRRVDRRVHVASRPRASPVPSHRERVSGRSHPAREVPAPRRHARSPSATYPLLRRFLAQLHTLGYARASVARKVGSIHTFYRWAVAAGSVAEDPSLLLGRPKVVNRLPTVLRQKEAAALAEAPAIPPGPGDHEAARTDRSCRRPARSSPRSS